jgi:hypothetical protein
MLDVVVSFVLGACSMLALERLLRRRAAAAVAVAETGPAPGEKAPAAPAPEAGPAPRDKVSSALERAVEAFAEELHAMDFDGPALGARADALPEGAAAEQRRAVEAGDRARWALNDGSADGVRRALGEGRAALVRLDARLHGRPVPIDSLLPLPGQDGPEAPEPYSGERFHYTGGGDSLPAADFLIDWPEPGRPAIVQLVAADLGLLGVTPVTRTGSRTRTEEYVLNWIGAYDGLVVLRPGPTHLKLTGSEAGDWSLRLLPLDAAEDLRSGVVGRCDTVLAHRSDDPVQLTFQVVGDQYWKVEFSCACDREEEYSLYCPCDEPDEDGCLPVKGISGSGESRDTLVAPRRGLVTVKVDGECTWTIHTRPLTDSRPGNRTAG